MLFYLIVGSVALYFVYYVIFAAKKPIVYAKRGPYSRHVLASCPSLNTRYWPTIWAINRHVNTAARSLVQLRPGISFKRELLSLVDGGVLALDWAKLDTDHDKPNTPVFLILPGLTGSSSDTYVQWLACDGLSQGYRSVVMNNRGNGGVALKTARGYSATNTEDLEFVLKSIRHKYPSAKIVAAGVSLGGCILVQHLIKSGRDTLISQVITISSPWNLNTCAESMNNSPISNIIYNGYLTRQVKNLVKRNKMIGRTVLSEKDHEIGYEKIMKCRTMQEFDATLVVPMFGYKSVQEYYNDGSCAGRLHLVKIPLFSFTAADDPLIPECSIPIKEARSNPLIVVAVTKCGGHFGFVEGLLPTGHSWMNRLCREFLSAVKNISAEHYYVD